MQIKGILFDFDGTLANTIDLIIATFEHTCKTVLGSVPAREDIINTFGLPLGDAFVKLVGRDDLVEEMRAVYKDFNEANHDTMICPIAGVEETLRELRARGLKLAVVTSKKPAMLRRGLACLDLAQYIDVCIALGDTKESKPHPAPMLAACKALKLKPCECLCVGDSPFDLQSGRHAGAKTVAVRYTYFDWDKLVTEGKPDYAIGRQQELVMLINEYTLPLTKGLQEAPLSILSAN